MVSRQPSSRKVNTAWYSTVCISDFLFRNNHVFIAKCLKSSDLLNKLCHHIAFSLSDVFVDQVDIGNLVWVYGSDCSQKITLSRFQRTELNHLYYKNYLVKMQVTAVSESIEQGDGLIKEFPNAIIIHQPPHNFIKLQRAMYHRHFSASQQTSVHMQPPAAWLLSGSEPDKSQQMNW